MMGWDGTGWDDGTHSRGWEAYSKKKPLRELQYLRNSIIQSGPVHAVPNPRLTKTQLGIKGGRSSECDVMRSMPVRYGRWCFVNQSGGLLDGSLSVIIVNNGTHGH